MLEVSNNTLDEFDKFLSMNMNCSWTFASHCSIHFTPLLNDHSALPLPPLRERAERAEEAADDGRKADDESEAGRNDDDGDGDAGQEDEQVTHEQELKAPEWLFCNWSKITK